MYLKRKYKVKPRGLTLAEFYAEENIVRVCYKDDDDIEWIAIADCKTIRQAQRLAELMNQELQSIEQQ